MSNLPTYRGAVRQISLAATRFGAHAIRLSLGLVLFWFGVLKFVPGLSPAESLAVETVSALTFGVLAGDTARVLLAVLETFIGVALLSGRLPRTALAALALQMAGTLTPLALFPSRMWLHPFVPSSEGQYILKNLVLISAAFALSATVLRTTSAGGTRHLPSSAAAQPRSRVPAGVPAR